MPLPTKGPILVRRLITRRSCNRGKLFLAISFASEARPYLFG